MMPPSWVANRNQLRDSFDAASRMYAKQPTMAARIVTRIHGLGAAEATHDQPSAAP